GEPVLVDLWASWCPPWPGNGSNYRSTGKGFQSLQSQCRHEPRAGCPLRHLLNPRLADLQEWKSRGPTCWRHAGGNLTGRAGKATVATNDHASLAWMLVVLGLAISGIGVVWILAPSIPWLGRLPGDIRFEKEPFRFCFPLVTCLVLSLLLSLIVWIVRLF